MELASLTKWVYDFGEGSRTMRALLGGKGANVAEMTRVLGPDLVPPGFVITTEACVHHLRNGRPPSGLDDAVRDALARLERTAGRGFGDPADPLLVSVRSGARDSMPGMLDTVLNVGLNDASVAGLAAVTGDDRFAWDCYRRLVQMFGNVVLGVPGARFEDEIGELKRRRDVQDDRDLDASALRELTHRFLDFVALPADPREQLDAAITAVFESWRGPRAIAYRRLNRIPEEWGTAVNVQQMVFGNRGARSGSGVAFSRDEITGAPEPSGDFLVDAQGEDVVSGVRTPRSLDDLDAWMPGLHGRLCDILRRLEHHYGDMQDTEFTVEDGRLYMLQTRSAKRHAHAALRFAVDAVEEGLLTRAEAIATIDADRLDALLHPTFDPAARYAVAAVLKPPYSVSASPAVAPPRPDAPARASERRAGRRGGCGCRRRPGPTQPLAWSTWHGSGRASASSAAISLASNWPQPSLKGVQTASGRHAAQELDGVAQLAAELRRVPARSWRPKRRCSRSGTQVPAAAPGGVVASARYRPPPLTTSCQTSIPRRSQWCVPPQRLDLRCACAAW